MYIYLQDLYVRRISAISRKHLLRPTRNGTVALRPPGPPGQWQALGRLLQRLTRQCRAARRPGLRPETRPGGPGEADRGTGQDGVSQATRP